MWIYSGKRTQKKKAGYVADFCPICREITAFQLFQLGEADHIYGLTLGAKKVLGHSGICQQCHANIPLNGSNYETPAPKPESSLESLILRTFPTVRQARAGRLHWEEMAREGKLTSLQRRQMLLEPFRVYFPAAEDLNEGIHFGGRPAVIFLICFAAALALLYFGNTMENVHRGELKLMPVIGTLFGGGSLAAIILTLLEPSRRFARQILPGLVRGLAPLKPSKVELADCLARLKRADYAIGKMTRLDLLCDGVEPNGAAFFNPDGKA